MYPSSAPPRPPLRANHDAFTAPHHVSVCGEKMLRQRRRRPGGHVARLTGRAIVVEGIHRIIFLHACWRRLSQHFFPTVFTAAAWYGTLGLSLRSRPADRPTDRHHRRKRARFHSSSTTSPALRWMPWWGRSWGNVQPSSCRQAVGLGGAERV